VCLSGTGSIYDTDAASLALSSAGVRRMIFDSEGILAALMDNRQKSLLKCQAVWWKTTATSTIYRLTSWQAAITLSGRPEVASLLLMIETNTQKRAFY